MWQEKRCQHIVVVLPSWVCRGSFAFTEGAATTHSGGRQSGRSLVLVSTLNAHGGYGIS